MALVAIFIVLAYNHIDWTTPNVTNKIIKKILLANVVEIVISPPWRPTYLKKENIENLINDPPIQVHVHNTYQEQR